MKKICFITVTLAIIFIHLFSCTAANPFIAKEVSFIRATSTHKDEKKLSSGKNNFHKMLDLNINFVNEYGNISLNANVYRPHRKIRPKTVVILVPGSGNVSRRGESSGNGVDSYKGSKEIYHLWAKVLAEQGIFVLSYDKRTCTKEINSICQSNPQIDIEQKGIKALAEDLDQVINFTLSNLKSFHKPFRLVLMSSTQGASTISLAQNINQAHGIILFSPIIGDIESMWVEGLAKAIEKSKSEGQKYQLENRKESMVGFFQSLKNNQFPDHANVKGATAKFWRSWMESSIDAMSKYKTSSSKLLLMFSDNDVFSYPPLAIKDSNIISKKFAQVDRNFIANDHIPNDVVSYVVDYIENLSFINDAH